MEALSVEAIPTGEGWQYEPKWDGFRCIMLRDGADVEIQSKAGKSLSRYFPEVVSELRAMAPRTFALDGELAVPAAAGFSFDALLQRIHPAASRIARLSVETPAIVIVFDLLADQDGTPLLDRPLRERRASLETFARQFFPNAGSIRLSPVTTEADDARRWLNQVGTTLDGIVAKRLDMPYRSGERSAMQKIKNYRSADCVVGGFRYNEGRGVVGSLLLGLYDEDGLLNHVGFTSGIKEGDKPAMTRRLEQLIAPPGFTGAKPGGPSRWSNERSTDWQPLKPKLVVEVRYDHYSGGRFRHGTQFMRWRPDKSPKQCTMQQIQQASTALLDLLA